MRPSQRPVQGPGYKTLAGVFILRRESTWLQILPRHSRPLLFRLQQAHRYASENNVHRNARMGLSVIGNDTWCDALEEPIAMGFP